MNELPMEDYQCLTKVYGDKNVENACIFILGSTDPAGLAVSILPTKQRVTDVLDAVHGEYLHGWTMKYGLNI